MSTTLLGKSLFAIGALLTSAIYHAKKTKHKKPFELRNPEAEKDRIRHLPGLQYKPGFEQFSGYLDVTPTKHIFYWYVESQEDPANAPLVLWTNGGPGCSGLLGFGAEHGPFIINNGGNLHENPFSWNKIANMLYVEQPAGVGYSYVDDPADKFTNDAQAAADNYQLIVEFLKRFPERRSNGFYLASESYGGHYIPQLALEILDRDTGGNINFKGFAIGNPYVDPYSNMVAQFESYYSHGLIAKPLFDQWAEECKSPETWLTKTCDKLTDSMFDQFGPGINPYALDYPVCIDALTGTVIGSDSKLSDEEYTRKLHYASTSNRRQLRAEDKPSMVASCDSKVQTTSSAQVDTLLNTTGGRPPFLPNQDEYKPCSQVNLERYFNRKDVRDAVHFYEKVPYYKWSPCGGIKYSTEDDNSSVVPIYKKLIDMAKAGNHSLNMLIYSGDDDSICATAGTQEWLWSLGVPAKKIWRAWHTHGQTSGFATVFDLGEDTKAKFSFVTVHGAGHEVPAYKPYEALELFGRFLNGHW